MSASGKKIRLKMKNPMKLCPLRPATRAGQNAIATHTIAQITHHMKDIGLPVHQRFCDLEGSWPSSSLEPLPPYRGIIRSG